MAFKLLHLSFNLISMHHHHQAPSNCHNLLSGRKACQNADPFSGPHDAGYSSTAFQTYNTTAMGVSLDANHWSSISFEFRTANFRTTTDTELLDMSTERIEFPTINDYFRMVMAKDSGGRLVRPLSFSETSDTASDLKLELA